jgi:hypothetical protein
MPKVMVHGWRDPSNPKPISLVDAIRRHAGLSLPAAKVLLDAFAESGAVAIDLATFDEASAFVQEAESFGAIVGFVQTGAPSGR